MIAAITISPVFNLESLFLFVLFSIFLNSFGTFFNKILSCGLFGPASDGSIVSRSKLIFY